MHYLVMCCLNQSVCVCVLRAILHTHAVNIGLWAACRFESSREFHIQRIHNFVAMFASLNTTRAHGMSCVKSQWDLGGSVWFMNNGISHPRNLYSQSCCNVVARPTTRMHFGLSNVKQCITFHSIPSRSMHRSLVWYTSICYSNIVRKRIH